MSIKEVESALRSCANPTNAKATAHILNTSLEILGLTVPKARAVFSRGFSFSSLPHSEQRLIWNAVVRSTVFEVRSLAFFYFETQIEKLDRSDWSLLKKWIKFIENWEHADRYAKLVAQLHEQYPGLVYPTLQKWNASKEPWKRRLSVTSLFLYSSQRKIQPSFKKVIALIGPLLADTDPYVRKGVGWTLREAHNVYPKETRQFVKKHLREISAVSFSYATEKYPKAIKERLKKIRKRQVF